MPPVEIRRISHQNYVAAGVIQRCWRGYRARKHVWSYGGARYVFCVVKVQCAWRVFMANKRMLAIWHEKVYHSAHKIKSMYYRWHSKRLRLILHLTFVRKCVVKLQSAYRRRAARRMFELVKAAFKNRTAERIQSSIRKFMGRCRVLRRKRLIDILVHHVTEAAPLYSNGLSSSMSPKSDHDNDNVLGSRDDACRSIYEQLLNSTVRTLHKLLIMSQFHQALVDTERTLQLIDMQLMVEDQQEEALFQTIDVSRPETWPTDAVMRFTQSHTPILMILRTILLVCKSCCWAKYGRTKQVNVNTLEQTMGTVVSLMYEQRKYWAMWCQRRRLLLDERNRLLREYEEKVLAAEEAAAEAAEAAAAMAAAAASSGGNSGANSVENSRRSTMIASSQRPLRQSSKQLPMSRKSSQQTLMHSAAPSSLNVLHSVKSMHVAASSAANVHVLHIPMPAVPIVPDFEDAIQTFLHKRVWHQFSVYEILDVFHMIASWPRYSLLTQYDACFCKGSMLHVLMYLEHWQEVASASTPPLFRDQLVTKHRPSRHQQEHPWWMGDEHSEQGGASVGGGGDTSTVASRKSSSVLSTARDRTNSHSAAVLDTDMPWLLTTPSAAVSSTVLTSFAARDYSALRKLIVPLFGYAVQHAPSTVATGHSTAAHQKQRRRLSIASETEPEEPTPEQLRQQHQQEQYDRLQRLMQRAWRLTERAKHLISAGSPESYELFQRLEFMASVNVPARLLGRHHKRLSLEIPMTAALRKLRAVKPPIEVSPSPSSGRSSSREGGSRKGRRSQGESSSSIQFNDIPVVVEPSEEDESVIHVHFSIDYTMLQAGPVVFVFGQIDDFVLQPPEYMADPSVIDLCLRDTPYREVPSLLERFGAVPVQPFLMLSHEVKQVATAHSLYVTRGSLYTPSATTTLTAVNEEDDHDDAGSHPAGAEDDGDDAEHDDGQQDGAPAEDSVQPEQVSSLSKKAVLDQQRFQEYMQEHLVVTSVPLLSSASATSSFNIPYRPLVTNVQGEYRPPISCHIQPRLALSLPFVQEKRDRSINFNEVRYATMLLQRVYRGFAGRLRFKRIAAKKREIMRRWWLANKVLDRWKRLRHRHEMGAIRLQAMVKGWMWRRRLRHMHTAALLCQCAFRIFRAKSQVHEERMRLEGGPQIHEMLRGGKLLELQGRRFMLKIFRCGFNYRLEGFDMIRGFMYHGHVHKPELLVQLQQYNEDVIVQFRGDRTSLASKQAQINLWQHDKVVRYIVDHLQLVHRIYGGTNGMGGSLEDNNNDLYLVVTYEPQQQLHAKLQAPRLPDLLQHPVVDLLKFKPSPFTSFKELRQQEQQRLQRQQRQRQQQQQQKQASQPGGTAAAVKSPQKSLSLPQVTLKN